MKKYLKIIGIGFILCVVLSFCIPKGGPNWLQKRLEYVPWSYPYHTYEIAVDFSKPSCEDRLFIYDCTIGAELIYCKPSVNSVFPD